jgi:hypothetical protein
MTDQLTQGRQELRERALLRLKQKRDFGAHLFAYVVVNTFLIGIWPAFPLFLWSIGLVFNAWDVYWRKPPSEERIHQEMKRLR